MGSKKSKNHWARQARKGQEAQEQFKELRETVQKSVKILCKGLDMDYVPSCLLEECQSVITQLREENGNLLGEIQIFSRESLRRMTALQELRSIIFDDDGFMDLTCDDILELLTKKFKEIFEREQKEREVAETYHEVSGAEPIQIEHSSEAEEQPDSPITEEACLQDAQEETETTQDDDQPEEEPIPVDC